MKSFFARFLGGQQSKVVVNGETYVGNSVSISNGVVTIDGVVQDSGKALAQPLTVQLFGDVEHLETERGNVTVSGSAGAVSSVSGDVTCGAVTGSVSTVSGDVRCGPIAGRVSTISGDIGR